MPAKVPLVKEVAWRSAASQLLVIAGLVAGGIAVLGDPPSGFLAGAVAYAVLSQALRRGVARHQRAGVRSMRRGDFEGAIPAFRSSYEFFSRHPWLDRYRFLTLLSSSAYSYREMALCNIAFSEAQLGRRKEAIDSYRRALAEFPGCSVARCALALAQPEPPGADAPVGALGLD